MRGVESGIVALAQRVCNSTLSTHIIQMPNRTVLTLGSPPRLRRPNLGLLARPPGPNLSTLRPAHQRLRLVPLLQLRCDGGHRIRAVVRDAENRKAAFCAEFAEGGDGASWSLRPGSVGVLCSHEYSGVGWWV